MADNIDPKPTQPQQVITASHTTPTVSVALGGTSQLSITAKDSTGASVAGASFAYSTDNPSVATVNQSGLITAYSGRLPSGHVKLVGGTANISANLKRGDGSPVHTVATTKVTVAGQ